MLDKNSGRGKTVELPASLMRQLRVKAAQKDTSVKHLVINTLCRALRLDKPKGAK